MAVISKSRIGAGGGERAIGGSFSAPSGGCQSGDGVDSSHNSTIYQSPHWRSAIGGFRTKNNKAAAFVRVYHP
jgi:hypothetical protein